MQNVLQLFALPLLRLRSCLGANGECFEWLQYQKPVSISILSSVPTFVISCYSRDTNRGRKLRGVRYYYSGTLCISLTILIV
jgi:hypothetical protein